MVVGLNYLQCYLPYKEEDLIANNNNRESKSVIEFRICPSSFHLDTWATKEGGGDDADDDDGDNNLLVTILCRKRKPLRSEKCVQIEIDALLLLPTASSSSSSSSSSSILSDVLLADVPYLPEHTRERLAGDLICAIRDLINKRLTPLLNKKLVMCIQLQFHTYFYLLPLQGLEESVLGQSSSSNYRNNSSPEEEEDEDEDEDEDEEECAICLDKFLQSRGTIGSMLCLHKFHWHCLYLWWGSKKRGNCPLCRFEMPVPPLAFDELAERLRNEDLGDDDVRWNIYVEESLHHYEKYK